MKAKLILFLFAFIPTILFSQRNTFFSEGGNPIPNVISGSNLSISTTSIKSGTSASQTHNLTSVPAGSRLVLTTTNEQGGSNCTVSSSPSITWTKRSDATGSFGNAEIYTAEFAAGGSIDVTSNWASTYQSSVCYVLANYETTAGGAENHNTTSQTQPSVAVTSTRANSILFICTSDWDANDGASRVYRNAGTTTEKDYSRNAAAATLYHYYTTAPTVTSYTVGISSPTLGGCGTAVYELRGN